MHNNTIAGFTAGERDFIRRAFDQFFSTLPAVEEGIAIKRWRGGANAGKPKIPPAAQSLIDRGLLRLDAAGHSPILFFTDSGIDGLRTMMRDKRLADPEKFAHIRCELGIDQPSQLAGHPEQEAQSLQEL